MSKSGQLWQFFEDLVGFSDPRPPPWIGRGEPWPNPWIGSIQGFCTPTSGSKGHFLDPSKDPYFDSFYTVKGSLKGQVGTPDRGREGVWEGSRPPNRGLDPKFDPPALKNRDHPRMGPWVGTLGVQGRQFGSPSPIIFDFEQNYLMMGGGGQFFFIKPIFGKKTEFRGTRSGACTKYIFINKKPYRFGEGGERG